MYRALQKLEVDGKKYEIGDTIPGVDSWTELALKANLNQKRIEKVEDGENEKPSLKSDPSPTSKSPEVIFKCEFCGREFKNKKALKIHVTLAHKK